MFNRTGVTHLVSISGLHVTMVAALCGLLVGGLWRRSERLMLRLPAQKAAVLAAWMAALAYALLAGFEVPAQRTLYMLSVVADWSLWSGRNLGASRTLLLALLAVLLLDPWAVLATGFWLSFGAVAVLFFAGSSRLGEVSSERRWHAGFRQWGRDAMGRDHWQPAFAPVVLSAVLAGVATGQRRGSSCGEFHHHAAGARPTRYCLGRLCCISITGCCRN